MTGRDDTADADPGVAIDVRRGNPTDEELAALIAVLSEAYRTEVDEATAPVPPQRSAWELTQRGLRAPLRRDLGWRQGGWQHGC
ncbi:acyl-CoA carboxylase subunit epsilon [Microbacterium xanthum]|uniref:acyl-CoA carboxylase subunit epsilon n=1 Tax=Microbacterium xanthum TaxID=3079794 RepID=UPI002AD1F528|nr:MULTISPECIES: acyl-CoA carboxylase subunit epsilon [unclassified Microbacterium]MDZ8171033.1 acyl-CoA carboxylase subunit epsilon [Microbacterium sp. KSW-48]MDZ8201550.1 acyl-CoA carboxylase subunit epsilon [Microbacterium sp. SSW1-59]